MTYEEWKEHCLVDLERGSEIKLKASEEEIFFLRFEWQRVVRLKENEKCIVCDIEDEE